MTDAWMKTEVIDGVETWDPPKTSFDEDLDAAVEMIRAQSKLPAEPTYVHAITASRAKEYIDAMASYRSSPPDIPELVPGVVIIPGLPPKIEPAPVPAISADIDEPFTIMSVDHFEREYPGEITPELRDQVHALFSQWPRDHCLVRIFPKR